jgi:intracellular sulfur oxidation DsrE/DsrF family protein
MMQIVERRLALACFAAGALGLAGAARAADVDMEKLLENAKALQDKSGYIVPHFGRDHPMKVVFQLPDDPKTWPTLPTVMTHNVIHMVGRGVPVDFVLVAPGSSIKFFMKDYWKDGGIQLKRLHDMGVKMVACTAAIIYGNVKADTFLPFVGQAHESGIIYILKKQDEGYTYYKFR